mgnify:CR=1 FL=1
MLKKISGIAAALLTAAALIISAFAADTLILDDAFLRLDSNTGWNYLTRDNMDSDALSASGYSKNAFLLYAEEQNIYYYSFNSNKSNIITVKSFSDSKSESVFSFNDATYNQQQDVINSLASAGVIPSNAVITKSNEKLKLDDRAVTYVIEYTFPEGKGSSYGCAYVTVQNGNYISIDLTSIGSPIEKSTMAIFRKLINTVAFTRLDSKPMFTKQQMILAGGGAMIVLFIILLAVAAKKKKKYSR